MPIESSENWGRTLYISAAGDWRAARTWRVTGTANEGQVITATPIDVSPIASIGDSHPQNDKLKVASHTITQTDPFCWTVTANYIIPPEELSTVADAGLLTRPILIQWHKGNYTLPVDRDLKSNPIFNSAGDAFDPPQQMLLRTRHLRIVRYEPFFNIAKADSFEDHLNSNKFTAGKGKLVIEKGECLCESIEPLEEYTPDAVVIPIAYDFEIRRMIINGKRIPPYRLYLKDVGRRGWYNNSGTATQGELVNGDGEQVSTDIPLDGTGKPLNATIKVGIDKNAPIAAPAGSFAPEIVSELSTASLKVLGFDMLPTADFAGLGL